MDELLGASTFPNESVVNAGMWLENTEIIAFYFIVLRYFTDILLLKIVYIFFFATAHSIKAIFGICSYLHFLLRIRCSSCRALFIL
jgi:hypothetical protein